MMSIGLYHYLVVAAIMFSGGVFVMTTKRNAIGILIGVELVLNACNLNLVAFARYNGSGMVDGQIMGLFVIVLAAAEAAVAVAICMSFYNNLATIDADRGSAVRG